jgi:hypothetical protein
MNKKEARDLILLLLLIFNLKIYFVDSHLEHL